MPILGGPCSPQGQVRHVADLFRQIRHGNRNKTAKYVLDRVFFAGEALSINYGTVHGADLSGKEVANDVIELLNIKFKI